MQRKAVSSGSRFTALSGFDLWGIDRFNVWGADRFDLWGADRFKFLRHKWDRYIEDRRVRLGWFNGYRQGSSAKRLSRSSRWRMVKSSRYPPIWNWQNYLVPAERNNQINWQSPRNKESINWKIKKCQIWRKWNLKVPFRRPSKNQKCPERKLVGIHWQNCPWTARLHTMCTEYLPQSGYSSDHEGRYRLPIRRKHSPSAQPEPWRPERSHPEVGTDGAWHTVAPQECKKTSAKELRLRYFQ